MCSVSGQGRDGSTSRPQPTVTAAIPTVCDGREMERLGGGRKDERQIGLCDDISGGNSFQEYLIVNRMKGMVWRLKGKWIYRLNGRVQIRECKRRKEELLFLIVTDVISQIWTHIFCQILLGKVTVSVDMNSFGTVSPGGAGSLTHKLPHKKQTIPTTATYLGSKLVIKQSVRTLLSNFKFWIC